MDEMELESAYKDADEITVTDFFVDNSPNALQKSQLLVVRMEDSHRYLQDFLRITAEAADRVLCAVETIRPRQEQLLHQSKLLHNEWQALKKEPLLVVQMGQLIMQADDFFTNVQEHNLVAHDAYNEIIAAQEFQDLAGQLVKKTMHILKKMEQQLLQPTAEHAQLYDETQKAWASTGCFRGICFSQEQVDELLSTLGV